MSFGRFQSSDAAQPVAEINLTPLVDVMLVLLVIFMISAPLMNSAIRLNLPQAQASAAEQKNAIINLSIAANSALFWDDQALTLAQLTPRIKQLARQNPNSQLRLRVDKAAPFDTVAQVLAAAQLNGLQQVGFVTDPPATTQSP